VKKELTINLGYLLYGEEFELKQSCNITIDVEEGKIVSIGNSWRGNALEFKWAIAIPSLVNAHIHTADYAFQEAGLNLTLREIVSEPHGLKHRLLSKIGEDKIKEAIRKVLVNLISQGVHLVIDFREGGVKGLKLALEAAKNLPITYIPLGRPVKRPLEAEEFNELRKYGKGVGLSTPIIYTNKELETIQKEFSNHIIATHVAEDPKCHELNDYWMAVNKLRANIIVHGIHLNDHEIKDLSNRNTLLVLCPRSNLWFSSGIPPIHKFIENDIKLALGTDNAGWISANIWRELETTWNIIRLDKPRFDKARALLSMVTLNPIKTLNKLSYIKGNGVLKEGENANITFISINELDLEYSHNKIASIIKRCDREAIRVVMYNGLIAKITRSLLKEPKINSLLHSYVILSG